MTIRGKITDRWGKPVEMAQVFLSDGSGKPVFDASNKQYGSIADEKGDFLFTAPDGLSQFVTGRASGMTAETTPIVEDGNTDIILGLPEAQNIQEVTVTAQRPKPTTTECKGDCLKKKKQKQLFISVGILVILAIIFGAIYFSREK